MDASALNQAVYEVHRQGQRRGHYFAYFDDLDFRRREMRISGRPMVTFSSCSYLGLEYDPEVIAGAQDAYDRYGTQTSFSRGYLSNPLYRELEEELFPRLFGSRGILVAPSTSIAHQIAIPALMDERDAVVSDHQVHRSVDDAIVLQRARGGAKRVVLKHGQLDRAFDTIRTLAPKHRHVWFACDGIYSMYGDYLPTSFFDELLSISPNVRLYVDDAHGMSWAGEHGRGHFLDRVAMSEQVVVATSLAKAFGVGGGVIVCADSGLTDRIRLVGGPYCFSGPLRPGDLGAAVASARLHLSPAFAGRQQRLRELVEHANVRCREWGVPIIVDNEVPFFFVALGRTEAVHLMAQRLAEDGFHASVAGFPAVPARCGGVRIALSCLHTREQIDGVLGAVAKHLPDVLGSVGGGIDELEAAFRSARPALEHGGAADPDWTAARPRVRRSAPSLRIELATSIEDLDPAEWDAHMLPHGCISADAMAMLERTYPPGATRPEHAWTIRYALVRNSAGELLAAAPITTCLSKDDFVMAPEVSAALEAERADDPYLFTSKVVSTGTMLSEGRHLYLCKGPQRRQALGALVDVVLDQLSAQDANVAMIRDVPDEDADVREVLMDIGLVPCPMPDMFCVSVGNREDSWMEAIDHRRYRRVVRKNIAASDRYTTRVVSGVDLGRDEIAWARQLYLNIARKNLELNVFELPLTTFEGFAECPAWEWVLVHLAPEHGGPSDGRPVAVGICHHPGDAYRALLAGVDYDFLWPDDDREVSTYRQLLLAVTRRARALRKTELHLGMGAPREKRRFGAQRHGVSVFVRSQDTFQATRLQEFVQSLGRRGSAA